MLICVHLWTVFLVPAAKAQANRPAQRTTADLVRDADEARKRGDLNRAMALFATASKAKDFAAARPSPELIFAVGDQHFAQASPEGQAAALETYDLALTVYGRELSAFNVAQLRTRRAEVLSWQGKIDLAKDEIQSLRTTYKDDRRVNLLADLAAANLLLLSNQPEAARDALKPLVELNDETITPAALFALGRAYVQLKQPDSAVASFRTLWNRYGESDFVKRAVFLIGQVYFDRGDFLEARKLYEACAVVGAAMQTRVRPGDELVVKVSDPDYFARTRSRTLSVTLIAPSGDEETLKLEKNPVSDQLYVGRVQTALRLPAKGDGQLQVGGGDVIRLSYAGGKTFDVQAVDDGAINVDSVELPLPRPRHERAIPMPTPTRRPTAIEERPIIPTGKLASGKVAPGSPIYVQLIDADLDTTLRPDKATAEIVATLEGKATDTIKIELTETAERSGVFVGSVNTASLDEKKPGVLAFGAAHQVFARFVDEKNETPGSSITRESRKLGVGYHDAAIALAAAAGDGAFSPAYRVERDGKQQIVITDADEDATPAKDTVKLTVSAESGDSIELTAEETGPATGNFVAALPATEAPAARDNPRLLLVRPGDLLWASYRDARNLTPGSPTDRHRWFLDNQPSAGDFSPLSLVTTAWPFEVKPSADGEMQAIPREPGKGRVSLQYSDADALVSGATSLTLHVNTLISQHAAQTTLAANRPGSAGRTLDLVLGDKAAAAEDDEAKVAALSELNVVGDDVIRLAVSDEKAPTNDLVVWSVIDAKAMETYQPGDATPTIRLSDPLRRVQAAQDQRLDALRQELGERLLAARRLSEQYAALRQSVAKRLTDLQGDIERGEPLKRQLLTIDSQMELLKERMERFTALGAVQIKEFSAPASQPSVTPADDPPLVPGLAFEVVIDDPDIKGDRLPVRIRSVAGKWIDTLTVDSVRRADGLLAVRVETENLAERGDEKRLSLQPGGEVIVDYQDTHQPAIQPADRVLYLALASDATFRSLNPNYIDPVSKIRLGQDVHLEVADFDMDRSANVDTLIVSVKSDRGDALLALLSETEPHSGVFRGSFRTDFAEPVKDDDVLQAGYGGAIVAIYQDDLRQSPASERVKTARIAITGGSDGTIEAFSRHLADSREEMQLWFRTGQAAYQVGRKLYLAGAHARAEEYLTEAGDYFSSLVSRFPDDELAASGNYYLGNIQSLRGQHREALAHFGEVVNRWPKSEFVARARFKIGQSYESLGQFDQAADAFVLLTYHHPNDEHVPLAMIRMMNRYARAEGWMDAVTIAQKFVSKFPQHDQAGAVALKAGQWLTVAGQTNEALAWYASAEKTFAASDRDMPALLYWHAATMIQGNNVGRQGERADKVRELLNRVVYDYGKSEYVQLARIALEQLNQNN